MDHLPKVTRPFRKPLYPEVPFLSASVRYPAESGGYEAFVSFPNSHGFSVEELRRGSYNLLEGGQIPAVLQSWLFFGILTETFEGAGIPFEQEDFLCRNGSGHWVISTEPLQRYLWYWIAASTHQDFDGRRAHGHTVDSCLQLSNYVYTAIVSKNESLLERYSLNDHESAVLLSIATLGEMLTCANNHISSFRTVQHWRFPALSQALLNAGWCIATIMNMEKECDSSTLLYLSALDQHVQGKDHRRCTAQKGCQAALVTDWQSYQTKHVASCCRDQCCEVAPSMEEVGSILMDGDIPLIAIDISDSKSQIEVVRYREKTEFRNDYVAISHVWSDGLGNTKANSLPRCQIERIQRLVNKLDPEETYLIPFWIDTVCVPLEPKLKNEAIKRMDKTYRSATDVLVLDNSLENVTTQASRVEIMMRLRYSTWMSRLWTYQEGRLSQNLWFQLHDRPMNFVEVMDGLEPQDGLSGVSTLLSKEREAAILRHPNQLQLARALAYQDPRAQASLRRYADLPKQKNEEEEDARISALGILAEQAQSESVRSHWRRFILENDAKNPLSENDGLLRARITHSIDLVRSYAMAAGPLLKGIGREYVIGKVSPQAVKPGLRPAHHLIDVVRGLRGRTTSRLEDEAICLSVLHGMDVERVTRIPVLHWRWKIFLRRLKDFVIFLGKLVLHRIVFPLLADLIEKLLRYSKEARMRTFLSQLEFIPMDLIFWTSPRLQSKGWKWAPSTFLDENSNTDLFKGGERGYISGRGLLVKCYAIRLLGLSSSCQSEFNQIRIEWTEHDASLRNNRDRVTDTHDSYLGPEIAKAWKWAQLKQKITCLARGFADANGNTREELLDRSVILLHPGRIYQKGVLAYIQEEKGRFIYADYIGTLTTLAQEPDENAFQVFGQVMAPKRIFCLA